MRGVLFPSRRSAGPHSPKDLLNLQVRHLPIRLLAPSLLALFVRQLLEHLYKFIAKQHFLIVLQRLAVLDEDG